MSDRALQALLRLREPMREILLEGSDVYEIWGDASVVYEDFDEKYEGYSNIIRAVARMFVKDLGITTEVMNSHHPKALATSYDALSILIEIAELTE